MLVDLAGFAAFQSWSLRVVYLNSSAASEQPGAWALLMAEAEGFPHHSGFAQCNCSPSFFYNSEFGENQLIQADNLCSLKFQILFVSLRVITLSSFS